MVQKRGRLRGSRSVPPYIIMARSFSGCDTNRANHEYQRGNGKCRRTLQARKATAHSYATTSIEARFPGQQARESVLLWDVTLRRCATCATEEFIVCSLVQMIISTRDEAERAPIRMLNLCFGEHHQVQQQLEETFPWGSFRTLSVPIIAFTCQYPSRTLRFAIDPL